MFFIIVIFYNEMSYAREFDKLYQAVAQMNVDRKIHYDLWGFFFFVFNIIIIIINFSYEDFINMWHYNNTTYLRRCPIGNLYYFYGRPTTITSVMYI